MAENFHHNQIYMYSLNEVAQAEFGLDYDQLGPNEKEWCEDELANNFYKVFNVPTVEDRRCEYSGLASVKSYNSDN